MNLAVKLYSNDSNPLGIPGCWPSTVIELGEGTDLPNDGGVWTLMSLEEYISYVEENKSTYDNHVLAAKAVEDSVKCRKDGIKFRRKHGDMVINEIRYYTLDLPDDVGISLLGAFAPVLTMLNLGILQAAAQTISSTQDVALLDAPFDPNNPSGPTAREYFVNLILEGDPI